MGNAEKLQNLISTVDKIVDATLFLTMAKIGMKVNFALSQRHFIPNRSHLSGNGLKNAPDFYGMLQKSNSV
ncbi:hypothetical protein [uncultured Duncaniella sp.]|uniref:hypothetical protein n=1 Tax=uncultured Duncaniella sp. TaxID=2768039 RepID=UPI0025A9DFCA|nr:hypothetical protein [uncultured Duncaniella sp.]